MSAYDTKRTFCTCSAYFQKLHGYQKRKWQAALEMFVVWLARFLSCRQVERLDWYGKPIWRVMVYQSNC